MQASCTACIDSCHFILRKRLPIKWEDPFTSIWWMVNCGCVSLRRSVRQCERTCMSVCEWERQRTYCVKQFVCQRETKREKEPACDGWGFGHLPSDKISWQGNQRETNSAATRVQLSRSSPWWAFEKWSAVEIGFVWEASDLSLVRIIATCLHWLQRSVN